jgi:AcrR family transcriptional regulator
MGRKVGLDRADVVAAAATLADAGGVESVTLTGVAGLLGIRPPSLYAHVSGLAGLRRELSLLAADRMAEALESSSTGAEGVAALRAMCVAYRSFAKEHPGLYSAAQQAVAPGEDDDLYDALARSAAPVFEALRGAGVARQRTVHLARALRSALHGFVELERTGGFGMPESVDASFRELVELLMAGVQGTSRT